MKLTSRDVVSFFRSPPKVIAGVLIYGNDPMRVSSKREQFIKSLLGSNADEEMRLARISRENLKKAPEQAIDLCKAQGFFPGERALLIEEANETISDIIIKAVEAWKDGDATIVVTAGSLKPSSSLRKLFEQKKNSYRFAFDNYESLKTLEDSNAWKGRNHYTVAIGSERGWSNEERNLLRENNFLLVSMGPRVLRQETAMVAGLGQIMGQFWKL